MGTEEFSTDNFERPSQPEIEEQNEEEWKKYGTFVPQELRGVADEIFNMIGENPNFFQGLSSEKRAQYVDMLRAYQAIPSGADSIKKKSIMRKEISKLLR